MKEYQFTTDSYRLFVALNRLADCENTWFNCGPSQKYILRQIKAADLSLVSNGHRNSLLQERAAYSRNGHGNAVLEANMDIALLMLYGQILYHGRSFAFALSKWIRSRSGTHSGWESLLMFWCRLLLPCLRSGSS